MPSHNDICGGDKAGSLAGSAREGCRLRGREKQYGGCELMFYCSAIRWLRIASQSEDRLNGDEDVVPLLSRFVQHGESITGVMR